MFWNKLDGKSKQDNMYHIWCGQLQQDINEEYELVETFGPRKQNRLERVVQQRLEQLTFEDFISKLTEKVKEN